VASCRAGAGTQAGLISRPPSVRFRPLQRGRPRGAALVNRPRKGPTFRRAPDSNAGRCRTGRGQQPLEQHRSKARWQTACRTSASRRLAWTQLGLPSEVLRGRVREPSQGSRLVV